MAPREQSGVVDTVPDANARRVTSLRSERRGRAPKAGPESYEASFPALHRVAYCAAYRLTQDVQRAEDAAQEAMVRVYVRWSGLAETANVEAWVTRVASNLALDGFRRAASARRFAPMLATRETVDADPLRRMRLEDLLRTLPKRQREVIMLRVLADQSEADTAAILKCSLSAVRHHLQAGLTTLRTKHVAELIAPPEDNVVPVASPGAAIKAGEQRRASQRKTRGVVAGIAAFVVAATGLALLGGGVVPVHPDQANEKRNATTTTTTRPTPTTLVLQPDGSVRAVPVAPQGSGGGAQVSGAPSAALPGAQGAVPEGAPGNAGSGNPEVPSKAFPNADTTGVPQGVVLQPTGPLTITTPGAVIDGKEIRGCVSIEAPNVTIRNSRIVGDCYYIVMSSDTARNARLERVEVSGVARRSGATCVLGSNLTLQSVYVHGCARGVIPERNVRVESSLLSATENALQCVGCSDVTILRSSVVVEVGGNAAIKVGAEAGGGTRVFIDGNRLAGGAYSFYGGYDPGGSGVVTDVTFVNNVFGGSTRVGTHSYVGPNVTWANNVLEGSGAAVGR